MKFSEQWLRSWVNPAVSRDELVARLSMVGLEVDAVIPVAGQFSGVLVGEILSAEQHPDADKLRVCQVSNGSGTIPDADVTDVVVDCVGFAVGGSVTGVDGSDGVDLRLNGAETITVSADGEFVFATPLADAEMYSVAMR